MRNNFILQMKLIINQKQLVLFLHIYRWIFYRCICKVYFNSYCNDV